MSNINIFHYEIEDMPKLRKELSKLNDKRLLTFYKARRGGLIAMDGTYYDECDGANPWAAAVLETFRAELETRGHVVEHKKPAKQGNRRKLKFQLRKVGEYRRLLWYIRDKDPERQKELITQLHKKRFGR